MRLGIFCTLMASPDTGFPARDAEAAAIRPAGAGMRSSRKSSASVRMARVAMTRDHPQAQTDACASAAPARRLGGASSHRQTWLHAPDGRSDGRIT